jgi:hypothetical protein
MQATHTNLAPMSDFAEITGRLRWLESSVYAVFLSHRVFS